MSAPTTPFRLNPSGIARYFFLDCDRFLRFAAAPEAERLTAGIPERELDHSPLMRAVLASGTAWEVEVVERLLAGRVSIAAGQEPLSERRFTATATMERLRTEPVGRFIYQVTLSLPQRFYDTCGIDPSLLRFSDCHPDLIEVREGPDVLRLLRVIDAKRGDSLQIGYRVQILLYALALDALVKEEGIPDTRVDLDVGAVWLGGRAEPEAFDMTSLRPHIEDFLRRALPNILSQPPFEVSWHFSYNCERCSYCDHCREEMRRTDDVSRLTNLTTHGKKYLVSLGVRTLPQLEGFLKQPDADAVLGQCASLAGERHYLEGKLAAFRENAVRQHGGAAPVPIGENVAVFVTLQRELLGRQTYLAGVLAHAKPEALAALSPTVRAALFDAGGKPQPHILVAENPAAVPSLRKSFVQLMHQLLLDVHRYNIGREWAGQLSLQVYAHTDRDQEQITAWLLESLKDEEAAQEAMDLLLHFQGPDLMLTEEHPDQPVPFPIVILQNALTKMLALPVEVSYTLPESLQALNSPFTYQRKDYYHYPLGNALRSEAIHAVWHLGKPEQLDGLRKEGRAYLFALRALLWELRAKAKPQLFAWPPKFQLPARIAIDDPILSRLAFFARYESVVQCLALRAQRVEPRPVQTQLGLMAELVAMGANEFEVVGKPALEITDSRFPSWVLVRDNDAGRKAQLEFRDYACRNKLWCKGVADLALVGVEDVSPDDEGFVRRLSVKYATKFTGTEPQRGERFQLHPRFTDFNADRVIEHLQELDRAGGGLFVPLVRDPISAARVRPLTAEVEAAAGTREGRLGLTESQLAAYREIRRRRVVAIWGPPGTGKTHFLAAAILGLAAAHAATGKSFRVLITAFTHAAIENLLRKIDELARRIPGLGDVVALAKVKKWQGETAAVGEGVTEDHMVAWLEGHQHAVAGATVYSCIKAEKKADLPEFDLVVVDEASQVRVAEASVPTSLVGATGRLVMAGDDLQLPPIVQGAYPEVEPGDPLLHRSVFEAVRSRVSVDSPVVRKLLENRRMNDVLTSFAAELLYGSDYCCFDASVAGRRLAFNTTAALSEFCAACLDPAYPIVVVVLEGVLAANENRIEAALVADLVDALRDGLCDDSGKGYADDQRFFAQGLFIVSPHRAQIRAIRRELNTRREWTSAPFVDTVDKMQGQEADAVIISYGVSDPEYALMESEFIYSVNRLNVSITRARSKSIVCLPRPLLGGLPRVLESPDASRGLAFMQSIVREAERQAPALVYSIAEGVNARVLRGNRPVIRAD